jgi:hypothetical protein
MKLAIFLSGLQLQPGEPDLEKYAIRLKNALGINDQTTADHYTLKVSKEKLGAADGEEVDVATINLNTAAKTVVKYKIYQFNYAGLITGRSDRRSPLRQCGYLVWTLLSGFSRFVKSFFLSRNPKAYSNHYQLKALRAALLLPLGALSYLLRPRLKSAPGTLFAEYLCLDSYLKDADCKAAITGKFDSLLEHIAQAHPAIEGIELHTYGFGSIIGYDVLFPHGGAPSQRIRSKIRQLITIGSPYDFIKKFYPSYFNRRKRYQLALTNWYNVYSGSDILSSNFRHDGKPGPATFAIIQGEMLPENINYECIQPDAPGSWDIFQMYMLKIHNGYWGSNEDATGCLTSVVRTMHAHEHGASHAIAPLPRENAYTV